MIKKIALAGVFGVAVIGMLTITDSALSIPDVHFSYATNECVKVINYTDVQYNCEQLPSKFNHVWVK